MTATVDAAPTWQVSREGVAHFVGPSGRSACGRYSTDSPFGARTKWRPLGDGETPPRCSRCATYDVPGTVGHVEMCAAGPTYRQIDFWTRCGLLRLASAPQGPGTRRRWLASEVPVAALMARLTAHGVLPEAAERVARGGELAPGLRVVDQSAAWPLGAVRRPGGLIDSFDVVHTVTQHWDAAGGDVLSRSCSCGEEWTHDEDDCPTAVDDVGVDGKRAVAAS